MGEMGRVADGRDREGGRWERWGGWQMGEMGRVADERDGEGGRWERWGGWQMGEMGRVADGRNGEGGGKYAKINLTSNINMLIQQIHL